MRIEGGLWVSLVDERTSRVIYQVSTDKVTGEEFRELWTLTGAAAFRAMVTSSDGVIEFRLRAARVAAP